MKQAESKRILASAQAAPASQEARPQDAREGEQEAMTVSSQQPSTFNGRPQYEPCEECGAPLDPQQRYCVNCAARRGNGANPSSRYFAAMSKRARRPPLRAAGENRLEQPRRRGRLLRAAADRGRDRRRRRPQRTPAAATNEALLRGAAQTGTAAVASTAAGDDAATAANAAKGKKAKATAKALRKATARCVAKTSNGTVHQVTGFKPTPKKDRRRHQAGRRKPRTGRRQLHQRPSRTCPT